MSKTKRNVIIIGAIVGVFILLMVLFGTLFSLKTITVDYATTKDRVDAYQESEIINKSGLKKGENIVFADYSESEAELEKKFPYAKFNIVKVFPSTAIIYVYERVPVFRVLKDGFWHIYDEDLKCLEMVAQINLEENDNDNIPILNCSNLNLCDKAGEFINNDALKTKLKHILDGVYGFQATPINVMSDITLSSLEDSSNSKVTLKVKKTGTTIVIEGENLIKEKIAYAVFVYASNVSQNLIYQDHLEQITITVKKAFSLQNKDENIILYDATQVPSQ